MASSFLSSLRDSRAFLGRSFPAINRWAIFFRPPGWPRRGAAGFSKNLIAPPAFFLRLRAAPLPAILRAVLQNAFTARWGGPAIRGREHSIHPRIYERILGNHA